jgi:hypothetical protein
MFTKGMIQADSGSVKREGTQKSRENSVKEAVYYGVDDEPVSLVVLFVF